MRDLSRREFFRRFSDGLGDQIDLTAAKKILAEIPSPTLSAQASAWVAVGRMAEFAPGVVRELAVGAVSLIFRSRAEGVWLERSPVGLGRVALQTGPGGVILANLGIAWPNSRMLSHLTGEPIEAEFIELRDEIENRGEDK